MTLNEFFSKYLGKSVQYNVSSTTKFQCVDFAKCYCSEFLKLGIDKNNWAWGNAKEWPTNKTCLKYFTYIPNTPSLVPQAGDLCVWKNGTYGHIAVATGIGNTKYFCTVDQNISGKYVSTEFHNYKNFMGVLRKKG